MLIHMKALGSDIPDTLFTCKPALQLSNCQAIFVGCVSFTNISASHLTESSEGWSEEACNSDGEAEIGV